MNIAYCTDENYIRHTFISMFSLLDNNANLPELNIYVVCDNVTDESKAQLENLVQRFNNDKYVRAIIFIDFEPYKESLKKAIPWGNSLVAYGRLFLPYQENIDKILYLDCDTVVSNSIEELYNTDLSNFAVAGVQDNMGPQTRLAIGLQCEDRYINSGVLLMNLSFLRKIDFTKMCLDFIEANTGKIPCFDQDVINALLWDKIKILKPKYNVMTTMFDFSAKKMAKFYELANYYSDLEIKDAIDNTVVFHYTGGFYVRPWFVNSDHPKKDIYRKYMNESPWKDQYLGNGSIGKRTEMMKWTYEHLPFSVFILLHRSIRMIKRIVKH